MAKTTATKEELTQDEEQVKQTTKSKYSKDELLSIFDSIMFEGEYREDVAIRGKLKVTFKTRTGAETSAISMDLDSKQFNLMSTVQQYSALLNIGYSLTRYQDKDISVLPLEKRISFVESLPTVVISAISDALIEFDTKVDAALLEKDSF